MRGNVGAGVDVDAGEHAVTLEELDQSGKLLADRIYLLGQGAEGL